MLTTIQNEYLTVTVSSLGAELQSVTSAQGVEYLWNGDPAHWTGRSPILFPTIGALRNGRAVSAGGEIVLPKHGFARRCDWMLVKAEPAAVTYRLTDDAETRKSYPYAFTVEVCYSLERSSLTAAFTVKNNGTQSMPYCLGGHPGFRVPLTAGETFEDYRIVFDERETADCPQVDMTAGLILDTARNRLLTETDTLPLNHVLFRGDALIFDALRSRGVRLESVKSDHGIRMDFADFDFLGIWTPVDDAPFVCLEPWNGMATRTSEDDVFEHKWGARVLRPGEENRAAFTITIQ